ncbi:UDP-N-acetyl-D-mannosamine dehydrogenase [subsurface metagenome]
MKFILDRLEQGEVLVADGAMGTMIQKYKLEEKDFRGERFVNNFPEQKGNNDLLSLTKPEIIKEIHSQFLEAEADKLLENTIGKTLFTSDDPQVISDSKFIITVIGTPVDEHLNPEFTLMKNFIKNLLPYFKDGQYFILRSTVFPGTTEKISTFLKNNGKKIYVTFCPERIAQGKAIEELINLPQIVSGFEDEAVKEVSKLFKILTKDIIILKPIEAELAKLFTNTWRYIQFAIANQLYTISTSCGLDFYKIYDAMKYKYPRAMDFPSAGFAAGPCLFKDTMQIASFDNNKFFLGHAAMLINEGLPNFLVQILKEKYSLQDKAVGILGMAFKANIDDKRESLSYKLKKILEIEAGKVLCSDEYINEEGFVAANELIKNSDIIILGAPHKEYKDLIIEDKILVDVWNFYRKGGLF